MSCKKQFWTEENSHLSLIKTLIIDQDPVELEILLKRLRKKGLSVKGVRKAGEALNVLTDFHPDVVIIEPWDMDRKEIFDIELFMKNQPGPRVIILTCHVSLDMVAQVMDKGAFDFLIKPCPVEEILTSINRAVNNYLQRHV